MKKIIIGILGGALFILVGLVLIGTLGKDNSVPSNTIGQISTEPIYIDGEDISLPDPFDYYQFTTLCNEGDPRKMEDNLKAMENDFVKINIKKIDVTSRNYYCISGTVEEYDCNTSDDGITTCNVTLAQNKENIDSYIKPGTRVHLNNGIDDLLPGDGIIREVDEDNIKVNWENKGDRMVQKSDFYAGLITIKK